MAKGKKFNAAEKHFEEKCVEWRQKIRELEHENIELRRSNIALSDENIKLANKNKQLEAEMQIIAEVKAMTPEDVKVLIQSKRSTNELASIFNVMSGRSRIGY